MLLYIILYMMKSTSFSQLRNNAKKYFDAVERGEIIQVYRHGQLIAVISPVNSKAKSRWQSAVPLRIDGLSLSQAILAERRGE